MTNELTDKTALITGASRGIGRAAAVGLAECGVDIAVNFYSRHREAEETCAAVRASGRRAIAVQADVSQSSEVSRMVEKVERELGKIDILVNNAGIIHRDRLENIREEDWDRVISVNLKSVFLVTQAVLPGMRQRRWGRIINLSSVAAQTGGVTGPPYVASKAGIWGLTHSYAALLVKEGITVNTVAPALIDTEMLSNLTVKPEFIPVGRFGTVQEVAEVIVMLAKNGYMTGQTISANGGLYFT
ncbi:MAG: 3-oxoacyl-ACP reductase family protein [Desulforhabdus sp.]|jgi:3-oxoacyl-[acyl-carrier protein] reductase|nr:3-oxoacyl-ACP reductase family protein [Desulforhabdus sp.]